MPKLTDFAPRWIDFGDRKGLGFVFRCTTGHCQGYNVVLFANPLDGGAAYAGDSWMLLDDLMKLGDFIDCEPNGLRRLVRGCGAFRWNRDGDTFESMSLTPSVNCHECGHFTVTKGVW